MPEPASRQWLGPALLLIGSLGFAAAWILLAIARDAQCSWMAVLSAADAVLLLRLARAPSGRQRAFAAVAATVLTILVANWGIAAAQVGRSLGLLPWESMGKLGLDYAWILSTLANRPADVAWLVAALVLGAVAGR